MPQATDGVLLGGVIVRSKCAYRGISCFGAVDILIPWQTVQNSESGVLIDTGSTTNCRFIG